MSLRLRGRLFFAFFRVVGGQISFCALYLPPLFSVVGYPSGQREQTVNLPAYAFEGSNPSPTTIFFLVFLRESWTLWVQLFFAL